MRHSTLMMVALLTVAFAWGVATSDSLTGGMAWAQEQEDAAAAEDMERDEEVRRLPPYFAQVIAPYQREKVYAIQKKYEDQVKALQEQIQTLLKQRDAEIETVLVAEQREALQKIRAEAKEKLRLAAERRRAKAQTAETAAPAPESATP